MEVIHHGGKHTVTGSCHELRDSGQAVLIDCGLFQGLKTLRTKNWDSNLFQVQETLARFENINHILLDHYTKVHANKSELFSNKLDQILTHKIGGYAIFLTILFILFQSIFSLASYPMDWIDEGFSALIELTRNILPAGPFTNLLTEGIIAGIGGVVIFIPQIAILFAFVTILEETGYMARVTFIMDKLMRKVGLNGKSVVPLVSAVAGTGYNSAVSIKLTPWPKA